MNFIIKIYKSLGKLYKNIKFLFTLNCIKTLYFNFKMFPFEIAKKLPIFIYGKVKFSDLSGEIIIDAPIKMGMIGFGQPYEIFSKSAGNAQIFIAGKVIFKGHCQFGLDYFIHIAQTATLKMGNMSSLGSRGKIICYNEITFGNYCRIGFESQVIDTNAHQMMDIITNEKFPITSPILLGSYNYFSNRVSILQNTITPNYCTTASNSLCSKDYSFLGKNILIGGIPAKLIKNNISRDWIGEEEILKSLIIDK